MSRPEPNDSLSFNELPFTHEEIRKVVDDFYTVVAEDDLLKVPFSSVKDWPHHIERMTHFWWVRLGGRPYLSGPYNPVLKHFLAGFNATFLERWLSLFEIALNDNLKPEQAELWTLLAHRMGQFLSSRNDLYKSEQGC
jgi:hemoglobin